MPATWGVAVTNDISQQAFIYLGYLQKESQLLESVGHLIS